MISPAKHLDYAVGYLQLGMIDDARAELATLPPDALGSAPALAVRVEIAMSAEAWEEVVALTPQLVALDNTVERPWIAWAYALRELQRIEEAQEILLTGLRLVKNPTPLVSYNLACYACLLGDLAGARRLLAAVFAADKSWREIAREDDDLAALRTKKS
jgi:predicted Zn-dependent protease